MAAKYPQELRGRVLAAYDRGMRTASIVKNFVVSPAWAKRIKQVRREEGQVEPLPMGVLRVVKIDSEELRRLVELQPDATIVELYQRLGKDRCSESAVAMGLGRLGLI